MKILLFGFGVLFVTLFISFSDKGNLAHAGHCGSISNSDDQHHCRAVEGNDSGYCPFINDSDKKNYCRAVAKKDSGYCPVINDSALKAKCFKEAR